MGDKKDEADGGKIYYFTAFNAKHLNEDIEGLALHHEILNKDKMKTLTVALIVCLHLEVDPPDVPKVSPCCRVEAWYDPTGRNVYRSIDQIGENLKQQYERWQGKARIKKCMDPTVEEVRRLCQNLRKNAKDDRVLFHYNGHGVPRPTQNGEIWVFNKTFTKYIPFNLLDLQQWMGAPSLYVFDCHRAGLLINKFYETYCQPGPQNLAQMSEAQAICDHSIILAACRADEDLSQNPEIPADLFTACLTTPIRMAVQWYWLNNRHRYPAFLEEIIFDSIPGNFSNRQSMLGELNWIFTAVTDTIAWSCFSMELFQKLFRQDMLVASLFRNFLLAERIGKAYGVHPVSHPALPSTAGHPMWASWDEAVDQLMDQIICLYPLLSNKRGTLTSSSASTGPPGAAALTGPPLPSNPPPPAAYPNQCGLGNALGVEGGDMDLLMAGDVFLGGATDLPILRHASEETFASRQPLDLPKDLFDFEDSEGESNPSIHERADASNDSVTSSGSRASSPETSAENTIRRVPLDVVNHTQSHIRVNGKLPSHRKPSADVTGNNVLIQGGGGSSNILPIAQSSLPKTQQNHFVPPPQQNMPVVGRLGRTASGTGAMLFGTPGVQYGIHAMVGAGGALAQQYNAFSNGGGGYGNITLSSGEQVRYRSATFFADQLRAFEIWLTTANEQMSPAMQLPILLQVLLSQIHRIHALELLCYYVDLGAWAVKHCLAVGIFPYVVRLLQSNVNEVKPLLVFLWCKIIACTETDFTKHDPVRDGGYRYFSSCFSRTSHIKPQTCVMATFVLAKMLDASPVCQEIFLKDNFLSVIKAQLLDNPPTMNNDNYIQLRHWLILCLAKLWHNLDSAKWAGVRNNMQEELFSYLHDVSPLVRASTILALRSFVDNNSPGGVSDHAMQLNHEVGLRACRACLLDGSPLVRQELLALLAVFICQFESQLVSIASRFILEAVNPSRASLLGPQAGLTRQGSITNISRVNSRSDMLLHSGGDASPNQSFISHSTCVVIGNMIHSNQAGIGNVYSQLWRSLIILSHDPYGNIAEKARTLVAYVLSKIKEVGVLSNAFIIPRISVDSRSGTQSEVGSPDSVTLDHGMIRQSSPGGGALNETQVTSGRGGNPIHSAVFTAPSRSRPLILPGNWSGVGLLTRNEVPSVIIPPTTSSHLQHDAVAPLTPTNSLQHLQYSMATTITAATIRDLGETQLFEWCCKQFAEPGHRYQLFSPQFVAGVANYRTAMTAVQQCKLAGSSPAMTFSSFQQGDIHSSFAAPVTLHPFSMMGEDSSSLLRANREHLLQKHTEMNVAGRRIWSEVCRVPYPTSSPHPVTPSSQKSHSITNMTFSSLQHQPQHSNKLHHMSSHESVADSSLPSPVHLSQYMLLRGRQHPLLLRFHPYLSHMAVAEPGGVSIWDLQKGERRRYLNLVSAQFMITENGCVNGVSSGLFSADWKLPDWNANTSSNVGTDLTYPADVPLVTSLEFVNSHEERSLLLNGTSDGTIFIWRNYFPDLSQDKELVTAWYALTDLLHSNRPAGMVSHWHQSTGQLTVSGDVKVVRVWDTQQEARIMDMPTGADSCVSALDRSKDGRLIVAGMGDGYVRLFDTRAPAGEVMVSGGQGDLGWIHTIGFSGAENAFYSVDHYGRINLWNITNRPSRAMPNSATMSNFSFTDKDSYISPSEPHAHHFASSLHSIAHEDKIPFSHLPRDHPRRKALEPGADTYKGITRLGKGVIPTSLPQPLQSVYCASLKVDGSEARDHLALLGHGLDTREVLMTKVTSGATHASYRYREGFSRENIAIPLSVGFHSNQPFVGVGTSDSMITILEVKYKQDK